MIERAKVSPCAARCGVVALALACAMSAAGCRWLPMVRPRSDLDPRKLSDVETAPSQPPTLVAASLAVANEPLPPLPELHPVDPAVALAAVPQTQAPSNARSAAPRDAQLVRATLDVGTSKPRLAEPPVAPPQQDKPLPQAQADPAEVWRTGLEALRDLARKQAVEEARRGHPGDWWARHQVLDQLMRTDGTLWQSLLHKLDEADAQPEKVAPQAEPVTQKPEEAPAALKVPCVALCKKVEGFGLFDPIEPAVVTRGQPIVLYWEIDGLVAEADGSIQRARVATTLELRKSGQVEPVYRKELGTVDDACRSRRRDFYINARWTAPADIAPGEYTLVVLIDDQVAHAQAQGELAVEVR